MKSIKIINSENLGVVELSNNQSLLVNGGGWLSYALGYMLGSMSNTAEGHAVLKALNDFH